MKKLFSVINRQTALYLVFGVLTTAVNYAVFWVFIKLWGGDMAVAANAVAFAAAVAFAFCVNKSFVFQSREWSRQALSREIPAFLAGRLLSFGIEEAVLLVCTWLGLGSRMFLGIDAMMAAKAVLAVAVVILNYFFGRLVFKK